MAFRPVSRNAGPTGPQMHGLNDLVDNGLSFQNTPIGIKRKALGLFVEDDPTTRRFFVIHVAWNDSEALLFGPVVIVALWMATPRSQGKAYGGSSPNP